MKDYCVGCEYADGCEDKDVGFCDGCREKRDCTILEYCEAGHPIQCNNGYEEETYDDDEDTDDVCIDETDSVEEVTEEYAFDEDGNERLLKRKVQSKYIPPDLSAIKAWVEELDKEKVNIMSVEVGSLPTEEVKEIIDRIRRNLREQKVDAMLFTTRDGQPQITLAGILEHGLTSQEIVQALREFVERKYTDTPCPESLNDES